MIGSKGLRLNVSKTNIMTRVKRTRLQTGCTQCSNWIHKSVQELKLVEKNRLFITNVVEIWYQQVRVKI